MPVSDRTYKELVLEDPEGNWELYCGSLRRKPTMSVDHNRLATRLGVRLANQLDEKAFDVRINMGRVRHTAGSYYLPDVYVVPMELVRPMRGRPGLEVYDSPLPLVVEVWSPSTGEYDVDSKIPEYERRGDREIWRLHPYERALVARRRQPDGAYTESRFTSGKVEPIALPGVVIDLDTLFD
jgi:Uma2 family endonuclease